MNHIFYVYAYDKDTGKRRAKHTYHAKDKAEAIAKMKYRWNPEYFTFKATQGKGIDEANLQLNGMRRDAAKRRKIELDVVEYLQKRYKNSGKMFDEEDIELITNYVLYKEGL